MYFETYHNIVCFNVNFNLSMMQFNCILFLYILIYLDEGEETIVFTALSPNKSGYACSEINIV